MGDGKITALVLANDRFRPEIATRGFRVDAVKSGVRSSEPTCVTPV